MKPRLLPLLALLALAAPALAADEIPIDRVILSSSGLAHFEMRARVAGDAALEFPVRLEQVDDILKSLVVFDPKGRLGGVTLPGRQPLSQTFRDLPFTQGQLSSPMLLLNAYQGATVTAKGPGFSATGRILQVAQEHEQTKDGLTTRHRLSLMTAEGLKQAVLENLTSLQFENKKAREEISRALDGIRESAAQGKRVLTVNLKGSEPRTVALSYVVDAPLWKTAYRMVLPEGEKKEGLLQGWAVIENMTAADWNDVDLTLVSGNPVTYRQSLYTSYYVPRPEIPVQVFGRVMPRPDEGTVATAGEMERHDDAAAPRRQLMKAGGAGRTLHAEADFAPAPAPMMAMDMASAAATGMSSLAGSASAAESAEATTQVLFRFPDRFSLKSGQSMMLPFASHKVPMERVALYQPATHATHPLAAVEIQNKGDTGLPPGILTLYEESALLKGTAFVGDAQMPATAPGEKRLVSYALDTKTAISREDKNTSTEGRVTISQGVINTSVVSRAETRYTVRAPAKEDRLVILEHPRMHNYKLISPNPEEAEATETHYRLRLPVKAGESATLDVVLESQLWQSHGIDSLPAGRLEAYASSAGQLDEGTRKTFRRLAALRREIDAIDARTAEADRRRAAIFEDQARVRENLKSLSGKSGVQKTYLEKLEQQEEEIARLDKQKNDLARTRAEKMESLQEIIAGMKL